MVGGALEYAALVFGYRALIPIVAVLYVAAYVLRPERGERPAPRPASAAPIRVARR